MEIVKTPPVVVSIKCFTRGLAANAVYLSDRSRGRVERGTGFGIVASRVDCGYVLISRYSA